MEYFEKNIVCAKCDKCKIALTPSDIVKTVPISHQITYQLWHKDCGFRVSGICEFLPDSSYAEINYKN